jgi:hypothetical protein
MCREALHRAQTALSPKMREQVCSAAIGLITASPTTTTATLLRPIVLTTSTTIVP